ncbi:MAG: U32 family peptidase, partial [Muribaculaceae bacterium]|nr:U32 family peptidase [Muribaculaceae bacterium]
MKHKLELLAPARDAATAIEAIIHGADAVYIGAESFGARSAAGNSVADIAGVCRFAHQFDGRVYVTVNTIIYDSEIPAVESLVWSLYRAGVDALIVQDMSLLRMNLPPVALHASTQCDTRTPEKARFLEESGFSQLVLARELSLDEIASVRRATTVPLEVFVHGALCVSYSGDCHAGALAMGRSANRGECPQICRLRYSLTDMSGQPVAPDGHWLSLRDMNRIDRLADLAEAGATSFKIEGRLKDQSYVRNVVAAYSKALDALVAAEPERWRRSSSGRVDYRFRPDVSLAFNRGFTSYFLGGRPGAAEKMASVSTPKFVGNAVGRVVAVDGRRIKVNSRKELNNGDGLGWFGADGRLCGGRVNRVDGQWICFADNVSGIQPGSVLYRNRDKAWDDMMLAATAERTIGLKFTLRVCSGRRVVLDAEDERGNRVSAAVEAELQPARSSQGAKRHDTLSRLGETIYRVEEISDIAGDIFMPVSVLAGLRRKVTGLLDMAQNLRYRPENRRPENREALLPDTVLTYHANVSNRLAEDFYRSHGAVEIEQAVEVEAPAGNQVVMTTRYCLRRELGRCIRCGAQPGSWRLNAVGGNMSMRVDFDCRRCGMTLTLER